MESYKKYTHLFDAAPTLEMTCDSVGTASTSTVAVVWNVVGAKFKVATGVSVDFTEIEVVLRTRLVDVADDEILRSRIKYRNSRTQERRTMSS